MKSEEETKTKSPPMTSSMDVSWSKRDSDAPSIAPPALPRGKKEMWFGATRR